MVDGGGIGGGKARKGGRPNVTGLAEVHSAFDPSKDCWNGCIFEIGTVTRTFIKEGERVEKAIKFLRIMNTIKE